MNETSTIQRIATVLVVAALLLPAGAGVAAATSTVETGSEITDGSTITTEFNASTDSYVLSVNSTIAEDDVELRVLKNGSDVVHHTDSAPTNESYDSSSGQTVYNFTLAESDLERMPVTINENATLDLQIWNASDTDATAPDLEIQAYVENTDERAVIRVEDESDNTDTETDSRLIRDDLEIRTIEEDNVDVVGGNTTVVFALEGAANDEFENTTDGLSSGSWALMQASAEDDPYPVFVEEAGDTFSILDATEWDLEDHGSYYTYDADAGTLSLHTSAEDFDDDATGESIDIEASSDKYGVLGALRDFGVSGVSRLASSSVGL